MKISGRGHRATSKRSSGLAFTSVMGKAVTGARGVAGGAWTARGSTAAGRAVTAVTAQIMRLTALQSSTGTTARGLGSRVAQLRASTATAARVTQPRQARASVTTTARAQGRTRGRVVAITRATASPESGGFTPTWVLQAPTRAQFDGPVGNPFTFAHSCAGGTGAALVILAAVRFTEVPPVNPDWTVTFSQGGTVHTATILRTDIGDEAGDTAYVMALVAPVAAGVGTVAVQFPAAAGDLVAFAFDVRPTAASDILGKAAGGLRDAPVSSISYTITPTAPRSLLLAFAGSRESGSSSLTWSPGLVRLTTQSVPTGSTGLGASVAYLETTSTAELTITATFPADANDAWMKVVELRAQGSVQPPPGVVTFDQTPDPIIIPPDSRWLTLPFNGWWLGPQGVASLSVGNSLLGQAIDLDPQLGKDGPAFVPYATPRKPPVVNGVQRSIFTDREGMVIFRAPDHGALDCAVFWLKGNIYDSSATNLLGHPDGPDYEWGRNKPGGYGGTNAAINNSLYLGGPYSVYWGGKYKYELWSLNANKTKNQRIATSETLDGYVRRLGIALGVGDATFLGLRWSPAPNVEIGRDYGICVVNAEPGTSGGASFNDARERGGSCQRLNGRTYYGPFWRDHMQNYVGGGVREDRSTFFLLRIAGRWRGHPFLAGFNDTNGVRYRGGGNTQTSNRISATNLIRQVINPMPRPDGTGDWRVQAVWAKVARCTSNTNALEIRIRRVSDNALLAGPVTIAASDMPVTQAPFTTQSTQRIIWRRVPLPQVLVLAEDVPVAIEFATGGSATFVLGQQRDESLAQYRMRPGAGQTLVPIECQESCGNRRGQTGAARRMYGQIRRNGSWVDAGYRDGFDEGWQWHAGFEMERLAG